MSGPATRLTVLRWMKFNLVGGIGIGVQLVMLIVLKSGLHFNYLWATALAVEAAVVHNFLWHERFTWADRTKMDQTTLDRTTVGRTTQSGACRRFLKFNLTTGAFSILGNLLLMKLFAGMAHVPYLLANGIAITICSIANFLVSDRFVFRPARVRRYAFRPAGPYS